MATSNLIRGRGAATAASKRASLKPLHWVKVTRAMQGSLWADSQRQDDQAKYVNYIESDGFSCY